MKGMPATNQTIRFGIRKNNNGSGPCSVTMVAFLPTVSGSTATCASRLDVDRSCPGGLLTGYQGPLRYSAASSIASALVLLGMVLSFMML